MKLLLTFLALLCVFITTIAQPTLKPSIGIGTLPNDSDTICTFPVYLGDFHSSGYFNGDTIPDFTLYTTTGTPVNIQTVLGQGKPVLLIGGNLTCPVFRGKLNDINNMYSIYAGQLEIYIIYGMEAHPTTPSPYSGAIWTTNSNVQSGILYPQPTTYGERKALIDTLLSLGTVNPTILVDGPCNEWLSNFGPAPNNAYLIDTTGVIYEKQGWFHKMPDDMYCEIDSLLGTNSGMCNAAGNNGTFSFSYPYDTIKYGTVGSTLGVHATLTNNSATDNAIVDIIRWEVNVAQSWTTAMCIDVCLLPSVDTTQVTIPPGMTQDFIFYFYTDPVVDSVGYARVGFKNVNIPQNKFFRTFWGQTNNATSSSVIEGSQDILNLYPNPSTGMLFIHSENQFEGSIQILNINGRIIRTYHHQIWENDQVLDLSDLIPAMYIVHLTNEEQRISRKIVIK